ncbi:MAG: PhoH family protein [Alphaproteobacteria bacterium]|nr:PhoH family protein [Alphaproteobacteria bacterium]
MTFKSKRQIHSGQATQVEFDDNSVLARIVGPHNLHLSEIERRLEIAIAHRGNRLVLQGPSTSRAHGAQVLRDLYAYALAGHEISSSDVERAINLGLGSESVAAKSGVFATPKRVISARTPGQARYIEALTHHDLVFGLGPAGSGKTYLAVAAGVALLSRGAVDRLILSRPAVEAGERLGFLPGDMKEKVDPYLRPLYDALHDMLPGDQIQRRLDEGVIEVAPLAFMRGRTLSHCYVILDEAQNTTPQQMKMFLTRLGEGSRMAVTGDPTQTDLSPGQMSGLAEARDVLAGVEGVATVELQEEDVVRHPMVRRIVRAYAAHDRLKAAPPGARRQPG